MTVLAGGIGSGKSVVARALRLQGFDVYDCDMEARRLMESDLELKEEIKRIAGPKTFSPDGRLDRKELAKILFSDAETRREVNRAVHSAVRNDIKRWEAGKREPCFVETAIAAESGIAEMAREVWMVEASAETRLHRVKSRDGRTDNEIRSIMLAQNREEEMLAAKGVAIRRIANNPGDSLMKQISDLISPPKSVFH